MDIWAALTASLNHPVPRIATDFLDRLSDLGRWLLAKNWPIGYPQLRLAFDRFSEVLGVTLECIHRYFEGVEGTEWLELERPHKRLTTWDPALYIELLTELHLHQAMVWFLTTDLTRAANLIINAVREEVDPLYRFH